MRRRKTFCISEKVTIFLKASNMPLEPPNLFFFGSSAPSPIPSPLRSFPTFVFIQSWTALIPLYGTYAGVLLGSDHDLS